MDEKHWARLNHVLKSLISFLLGSSLWGGAWPLSFSNTICKGDKYCLPHGAWQGQGGPQTGPAFFLPPHHRWKREGA